MSNFRIRVEVPSVEIAFEVGSISEAAGILTDNETTLANIAEMGANLANTYDGDSGEEIETKQEETKQEANTGGDRPKSRRGRPPKANATNAPAPIPVPVVSAPVPVAPPVAAPAPAPVAPPVGDHGIPAGLVRANQTSAPAAAPVAPPAAPPSPPAPVSGLADKIIENLKSRFVDAPDGGAALTAWLKSLGLTKADASIDETYAVLRFTDPVRLESIAGALGVSAA